MTHAHAAQSASWPFYVCIFAAALAAYWPALRGALPWDHTSHVSAPVLNTTFWIEHRVWGNAVLGYHLAILAEHALAACLVAAIARNLKIRGAWLAGLVLALHPISVDSVAWIAQQKNTLSAVFCLSSTLIYLRFDANRQRFDHLVAFGLFVLALLTHPVTATLPFALLVILWWQRGRLVWRRDVLPLLPWILLSAAAGLFVAWRDRIMTGSQQFLFAGRTMWLYAAKLLWPAHLSFTFARWSPVDYLYVLGVLVVFFGLMLLARRNRAPLAAFLVYALMLIPALGYESDHLPYLASIALIVPLSSLFVSGVNRLGRPADIALPLILIAILGFLTWRQTFHYRSIAHNPASVAQPQPMNQPTNKRVPETLEQFRLALRSHGGDAQLHNDFGVALLQTPDHVSEGIAQFQEAVRIQPGNPVFRINLGEALTQVPARRSEALEQFKAALKVQPDSPQVHSGMGIALAQMPGRLPDAIAEFQAALRVKPDSAEAHNNLARALAQTPGRQREAVAEYRLALKMKPDFAQAKANLDALCAQNAQVCLTK